MDQVPRKRGRPPREGLPNVRDVALRAGVGIATVSRVINRSPLVTASKTERVLQVIQELGYKHAPGKRSGKRKRDDLSALPHKAVCVLLLGDITLRWITSSAPVYAYALESVEAALRRKNVSCMIRNVHARSDLEEIKGMRADGFLILGATDWNEWPLELRSYASVSMLGSPASGWGDTVTYNNASTGKLAANYLLSRGVKHAAIVGVLGGEVFRTRREAFIRTMEAAGGTVSDLSSDKLLPIASDINMPDELAVTVCVEYLRKSPRPEGIFITSDNLAPVFYRELQRQNVIPGTDVQVVSCNNERMYLAQLSPQPAVIDIQSGLIGAQAVESLFCRLQNPDIPRYSYLIEPVLQLPASPLTPSAPPVVHPEPTEIPPV